MVDDIDKECSLEELYSMIDSLRRCNRLMREILRAGPKMPDPIGLIEISHSASWPQDWERGKVLQRELGSEVIPYKTECESGAGLWDRITGGAWRNVR